MPWPVENALDRSFSGWMCKITKYKSWRSSCLARWTLSYSSKVPVQTRLYNYCNQTDAPSTCGRVFTISVANFTCHWNVTDDFCTFFLQSLFSQITTFASRGGWNHFQLLLTFTNGTPAPSAHPPPASRTPVIPVSLFKIHYIAMLDRSRMSSSWLFALLRGSLRLPSPSELPSSCQDAADHLAARPTRLGLPSVPLPPRFHHGPLFKISASAWRTTYLQTLHNQERRSSGRI